MKALITLLALGGLIMEAQAYETKKVHFTSNGEMIVGTLYLPAATKEKAKHPGVVITGAWTTVKEQMPKTYAITLAQRGYSALTFDFRGWGESGGKNRFLEDPSRKTADIIAAVQFLATRPEVDATQIVGLGICASSGYMAAAYTQTPYLKSVALVAPWLHNTAIVNTVYGGPESVAKLLSAAEQAANEFQKSGKLTTAPAASTTDANAIMFQAPYYTEKDRGLIKEYDNQFNIASWKGWLTYNAMESAPKLPGKILLVGSDEMALPQGAKEYTKLAGDKVEQVWLPGFTQFDFYDQKNAVTAAADSVAQYFNKTLQTGQTQ